MAGRSLWSDAWRVLRRNRAAMAALTLLGILALLVIAAPALSSFRFDYTDWDQISRPPSLAGGHLFGTDALGRDLFVRTLYGGRISLMVGVVASPPTAIA